MEIVLQIYITMELSGSEWLNCLKLFLNLFWIKQIFPFSGAPLFA